MRDPRHFAIITLLDNSYGARSLISVMDHPVAPESREMTAQEFSHWLEVMRETRGWSGREIARQLGCGRNQIKAWREAGAPYYIGLACAALSADLRAWQLPPRMRKRRQSHNRTSSRGEQHG